MCRRPAVSTISTSISSAPSLAERPLGDVDGIALRPLRVEGRARLLGRARCELLDGGRPLGVAGRDRDACCAPRPSCFASFAVAVVLPEPCRPAIRITVGPFVAKTSSLARAAHQLGELIVDHLDHHLARVEALEHALRRSPSRAPRRRTPWSTLKLTSASSSASRISRIALSTSSSLSFPRERRSESVPWRRSDS